MHVKDILEGCTYTDGRERTRKVVRVVRRDMKLDKGQGSVRFKALECAKTALEPGQEYGCTLRSFATWANSEVK